MLSTTLSSDQKGAINPEKDVVPQNIWSKNHQLSSMDPLTTMENVPQTDINLNPDYLLTDRNITSQEPVSFRDIYYLCPPDSYANPYLRQLSQQLEASSAITHPAQIFEREGAQNLFVAKDQIEEFNLESMLPKQPNCESGDQLFSTLSLQLLPILAHSNSQTEFNNYYSSKPPQVISTDDHSRQRGFPEVS